MATDYMEADDTESTAEDASETAGDESTEKDHTCLINKTAWPDAKPGDQKSFEVVHVYEDELAVKPAGAKEEPAPAEEPAAQESGYMD